MKRLFLALALILLFCSDRAFAASGCGYPSSLDTWADKMAGDSLSQAEFNSRTCAIESLEVELGTGAKGTYGSVKARLDDGIYKSTANTYSGGGLQDFSAMKMTLPAGISPPGTCTANKEVWIDTDAAEGQQFLICNGAGNGWVLGGSAIQIVNKTAADTTVSNTASETDLFSYSVPGGTLSTANMVRLVIFAKASSRNGSGTNDNLTLRFKYGATTLITETYTDFGDDNATTDKGMYFVLDLAGDNATGAQIANLISWGSPQSAMSAATGGRGTATEDSTAAKTLAVSAQWGSASTSNSVTMQYAIVEKML